MMLEPLAVKLLDKHYELEDALTLEGNSKVGVIWHFNLYMENTLIKILKN